MSPVDQTIFASDPKREGNCLAACVATFLDLELPDVPHFIEHGQKLNPRPEDGPDVHAWWAITLGFMAGHGYWPVQLPDVHAGEPGETLFVMGMSERGVCHQVLYRDGDLWHDPHPSRAGVLDVREVLAFRRVHHDHAPTESC